MMRTTSSTWKLKSHRDLTIPKGYNLLSGKTHKQRKTSSHAKIKKVTTKTKTSGSRRLSKMSKPRIQKPTKEELKTLPRSIRLGLNVKFNPFHPETEESKLIEAIIDAFASSRLPTNFFGLEGRGKDLPPPKFPIAPLSVFKGTGYQGGAGEAPILHIHKIPESILKKFKRIVKAELEKFKGTHEAEKAEICPRLTRFYFRLAALFKNLLMNQGTTMPLNKVNIDKIRFGEVNKTTLHSEPGFGVGRGGGSAVKGGNTGFKKKPRKFDLAAIY